LHVYGPTETTTFATWHLVVEGVEDGAATVPIGRPIANTEAYVLDARLQPVPVGVAGELHIGGPGVGRGYLNRSELTEKKFVPHPFSDEPGAKLYKTGDRVRRRANGDLEFLGRTDHQVKIRGFRVEPAEVEAVLAQHPAVRESVVVAREEEPGDKRLVAYYVVSDRGRAPALSELRGFLKAKLPEYMVPSVFVPLERLPLTSNGKVDRQSLPAPGEMRPELEGAFVAPRDELERRLAGIWEEVLGLEQVGVHDDFFELGGHSLLAARLALMLSAALDVDISIRLLLTHPTVEALADTVEQLRRDREGSSPTRAVPSTGAPMPPLAHPGADSASCTQRIERRPLLSLFAARRLAPVDAAALTYLPDDLPARASFPREEIRALWYDELPTVTAVTETFLGRIAHITLPRFTLELYEDQDDLLGLIAEALATAGGLGARAVSLTGLIPSATDYGCAIAARIGQQAGLPEITTGHAATAATVVLTTERLLEAAGRSLADAHLGVLGWGSIGRASLRLLLRALPHPSAITVCDVYGIKDRADDIRQELADEVGYRGSLRVVESRGEVPAEFYESTVMLGATNVADVLDVSRLRPGTVIVDDSGPHCFSVPEAVQRLGEAGDILFTEGGVLRSPHPVERVRYLPRAAERTASASYLESIARHDPRRITGCVLAGLLCARFPDLGPTVGQADDSSCAKHYERLRQLGFTAAEPHCAEHVLAPEAIQGFRQRFGTTPSLPSPLLRVHDRG
jgi:acyl carrier protein